MRIISVQSLWLAHRSNLFENCLVALSRFFDAFYGLLHRTNDCALSVDNLDRQHFILNVYAVILQIFKSLSRYDFCKNGISNSKASGNLRRSQRYESFANPRKVCKISQKEQISGFYKSLSPHKKPPFRRLLYLSFIKFFNGLRRLSLPKRFRRRNVRRRPARLARIVYLLRQEF